MKKLGLVLLFLIGAVAGCSLVGTFRQPTDLYAFTHQFAGCPSRPSCVSSVAAKDDKHFIEPIRYSRSTPASARIQIGYAIAAMPGATIAHQDDQYLHVVFQTPKMHFHDDVELLVRPDGVIDVRSISRIGYGDHGVNRKRVEEIRSRFDATEGRHPPREK